MREHDSSYKQEDGLHLTRPATSPWPRAKIEGAAIVLASATLLETLWNAETGRYHWLKLRRPAWRPQLPKVSLIDPGETPPEPGVGSPALVTALIETLQRGEQSFLFLNRRGYAPVVSAGPAGERLKAPDTDSWLVEHRWRARLVCHPHGLFHAPPGPLPPLRRQGSPVSVGAGGGAGGRGSPRPFPTPIRRLLLRHRADAEDARALIRPCRRGD